jgi:hypothetical protein
MRLALFKGFIMASITQRNRAKQAARALPVLASTSEQRGVTLGLQSKLQDYKGWLQEEQKYADELETELDVLEERFNRVVCWGVVLDLVLLAALVIQYVA